MRTSWNKLIKFHRNPPKRPDIFARNKDMELLYQKHRETVGNMDDYISNKFFAGDNSSILMITMNDFPYDLESNILHMVAWVNPNNLKNLEHKRRPFLLGKLVHELLWHNIHHYVFWENIPKIKSVHGIKHFQLFLNLEKDGWTSIHQIINRKFY